MCFCPLGLRGSSLSTIPEESLPPLCFEAGRHFPPVCFWTQTLFLCAGGISFTPLPLRIGHMALFPIFADRRTYPSLLPPNHDRPDSHPLNKIALFSSPPLSCATPFLSIRYIKAPFRNVSRLTPSFFSLSGSGRVHLLSSREGFRHSVQGPPTFFAF